MEIQGNMFVWKNDMFPFIQAYFLWLHTVWKLGKFTQTVFSQKFREIKYFLQMNRAAIWFDEIFSDWERIFGFSTLCFMKKQYNVVENWNVRNREIVQNHEFPYWMSDLSVKISECTFSEPTHAFYMIFATVTVLKNFCHFDFSWNQSLWIWKPQENWKLTKFRGNKTGEIAIFMTEFSIIDFT